MLQDKIEGVPAGGNQHVDVGCGIFFLQELPHQDVVLGLRETNEIEELRVQLQTFLAASRTQASTETGHELLVSGLLAVTAPQHEDIFLRSLRGRVRKQAERERRA